jgi:hypothetical protein
MERLKDSLFALLESDHPQTVRGVFYQATVHGLVDKTEAGYRTVQRVLVDLREKDMPYHYIADNTRWMRKPKSHDDIEELLTDAYRFYRKATWRDQSAYVEVWCEKDALAGIIYEVTSRWDVPLMVTRGYSSISFLYEAAGAISLVNKPCFIYYLGDYDPSGVDIAQNVEKRLRQYTVGADINFRRSAVTSEQIKKMNLPTRPTKRSDTRSKKFNDDSVELDAIPARELKKIVNNCIERHIDHDALESTKRIEKAERESLESFIEGWQS